MDSPNTAYLSLGNSEDESVATVTTKRCLCTSLSGAVRKKSAFRKDLVYFFRITANDDGGEEQTIFIAHTQNKNKSKATMRSELTNSKHTKLKQFANRNRNWKIVENLHWIQECASGVPMDRWEEFYCYFIHKYDTYKADQFACNVHHGVNFEMHEPKFDTIAQELSQPGGYKPPGGSDLRTDAFENAEQEIARLSVIERAFSEQSDEIVNVDALNEVQEAHAIAKHALVVLKNEETDLSYASFLLQTKYRIRRKSDESKLVDDVEETAAEWNSLGALSEGFVCDDENVAGVAYCNGIKAFHKAFLSKTLLSGEKIKFEEVDAETGRPKHPYPTVGSMADQLEQFAKMIKHRNNKYKDKFARYPTWTSKIAWMTPGAWSNDTLEKKIERGKKHLLLEWPHPELRLRMENALQHLLDMQREQRNA